MSRLKIILSFSLLTAALLLSSCDININNDEDHNIHGSGRIVTEDRHITECVGVKVKTIGNVYIKQGSTQSVVVEADDNIIRDALTKYEDGILVVGLRDGEYSNITLNYYVTLENISELKIEGAGNINCREPIHSPDLYSSISGAGNIYLDGSGENLVCSIYGAGNITAKDYISQRCKAFVNGAGNCSVFVTDQLDAAINGAGTIYYYGNPSDIKTSITGIGQIIKR
jgi:hypothetical protein